MITSNFPVNTITNFISVPGISNDETQLTYTLECTYAVEIVYGNENLEKQQKRPDWEKKAAWLP